MFKRANKITALLVAAASVMSVVPAMAADVTKVNSEDGTVYNAIAYKDGEFYVDGEIDGNEAAYYLADGKYNSLSDVDSGSDVATYGDKYVNVQGGDYFVDLTSGTVTDESVAENATDDAVSALKKKVKADTDGRYLKDASTYAADVEQTLTAIDGNKFGEVWYTTKYANKDATNGYTATGNGTSAATLNVYTDKAGSYIDADYNLGKIKVTTSNAGVQKTEYIENTDDTYDTPVSATKVFATVTPATTVLGQDKDYIYRKATVYVKTNDGGASIVEIDGKPVTVSGKTTPFTASGNGYSFNVIQKISKEQSSGDIGGVKYAKTVTTYVVGNSDGYDETFTYNQYTIGNGKVVGYSTSTGSQNVVAQTATLKSSNGYYYVDLGSASTDDTELYDNTKNAVDTDADGNLWRLNGGYIYQWNNDEDWDKLYKVDGSLDQLSVYDKDNIVAWNQDDEVYSVIGNKKAADTTTDSTTPVAPAVTAGWAKAANGTWSYSKADGTKATGWLQDGAAWYYLKADGVMATGWILDGSTWYYLNGSGAMATGWVNDNGTWYYLNGSGAMLSNTTVDGYKLGASGAWVK